MLIDELRKLTKSVKEAAELAAKEYVKSKRFADTLKERASQGLSNASIGIALSYNAKYTLQEFGNALVKEIEDAGFLADLNGNIVEVRW